MGREVGKIIKISDGWITVQLKSGEQCSVCASKSACFFAGPASKYRFIKIHERPGYQEGNRILIDYRESSKILAALVVFFLPLVLLISGYFVGNNLLTIQNGGIWGAIAGLLFSSIVVYLLNRWLSKSQLFLPKVIRKISDTDYSGENTVAQH